MKIQPIIISGVILFLSAAAAPARPQDDADGCQGLAADHPRIIVYEQSPSVLSAHKGNGWYMLDNKGTFYYQTILTEKALEQEVTADASSLAKAINATGHVAVYGIHFDTAKATITPDSEQTLTEIVKLLSDSQDLKLRRRLYRQRRPTGGEPGAVGAARAGSGRVADRSRRHGDASGGKRDRPGQPRRRQRDGRWARQESARRAGQVLRSAPADLSSVVTPPQNRSSVMSNCPFVRCAVGTGTTFSGFETNVTVKVPVTRVVEIEVTVKVPAPPVWPLSQFCAPRTIVTVP